jgi:hypothetical protein
MAFRSQLESVLRTQQGKRILDEAARLARHPTSKERLEELRVRLQAAAPSARRRD